MSHFKYEINERNLRLQLKDNAIPFNEEAWVKFESFSATQKNHHHENVMNRFNVSLNRNIILPVVFGGVIVLFSVLLFSFVNIKNPNLETATEIKPEPIAAGNPVEAQKKVEMPTPVKNEPAAISQKDSMIVATPQEINQQPETTNVTANIEKPVIKIEKRIEGIETGITKNEVNPETPKTDKNLTTQATNPTEGTDLSKKKKKHKRQLIVTEPTTEEDEQAPPPVSQTSASSSSENP